MATKNSHCSYCGTRFNPSRPWPRRCADCNNVSYLNPLPVAVAIVDVGDGVVAIRRAIPPDVGKLALPGGFIALGESWQAAAARELREETGICVDESAIRDFLSRSAPDGTLLVFGSVVLSRALLPAYTLNDEVSEMVILRQPTELAFDLHTDALERYLRPG